MGCGELPISHLSGFVKWLIGYPSPEFRRGTLDINVGILGAQILKN